MPSLVLSNLVANPNATSPTSLNLSLTSNGVDLQIVGSNVKALAFNAASSLDNSTTVYSVTANGIKTTFRADNAYNETDFALILNDGSSFTFELDQSSPNGQTLTNNGFDTVTSEQLRLWNLNG